MLVLARDVEWAEQPKGMELFTQQTDYYISSSKRYDVYGILLHERFPTVLMLNDSGLAMWHQAWLFDVLDKTIPEDWVTNFFHVQNSGSAIIMGPEFIVKNRASYTEMVLQEPPTYDRFFIYRTQRLVLESLRIFADLEHQKEQWLSYLPAPEALNASELVERLFVTSGLERWFGAKRIFSEEADRLLDGMWAFVEFIDLEQSPAKLLADEDWQDFCGFAKQVLPLVEEEVKRVQASWEE